MKRTLAILAMVFLVFGVHPLVAAKARTSSSANLVVNINTAPVAQLVKLPGIGPKKAQRIVELRRKLGGFKRLEDIMKVKGIGEKTFRRIRRFLTLR